jgi:hypothetical protein
MSDPYTRSTSVVQKIGATTHPAVLVRGCEWSPHEIGLCRPVYWSYYFRPASYLDQSLCHEPPFWCRSLPVSLKIVNSNSWTLICCFSTGLQSTDNLFFLLKVQWNFSKPASTVINKNGRFNVASFAKTSFAKKYLAGTKKINRY